jgi:hypothetical protein
MRLKGQGEDEGVVLYFVEGNNSLIGLRKTPVGIRHVLLVGKIILEAGVFTAYERMTKRQVMYFLGCNYMRSSTGFSMIKKKKKKAQAFLLGSYIRNSLSILIFKA